MTKAYKDMDLTELKAEQLRLKFILADKPTPIAYKQACQSLKRVNELICKKVSYGIK